MLNLKDALERLLKEIRPLEIINDTFLAEKSKEERIIGRVIDEETRKLVYFTEYVSDKKQEDFIARLKKLAEVEKMFPGTKIQEIEALEKEMKNFLDALMFAAIGMTMKLKDTVGAFESCGLFSIRRGWTIVVPKDCAKCKISDLCIKRSGSLSYDDIRKSRMN